MLEYTISKRTFSRLMLRSKSSRSTTPEPDVFNWEIFLRSVKATNRYIRIKPEVVCYGLAGTQRLPVSSGKARAVVGIRRNFATSTGLHFLSCPENLGRNEFGIQFPSRRKDSAWKESQRRLVMLSTPTKCDALMLLTRCALQKRKRV